MLLHDDTGDMYDGESFWEVWLEAAGITDIDAKRGARFSHAVLAFEAAIDAVGVVASMPSLAAEELASQGIEVEVIDPRTFRPLDLDTLASSVRRTGHAVVVDEGWPEYGISAGLATLLYEACFDWLDAPIGRVTCADVPMPYAKNLEQAALPQPADVVAAVLANIGRGVA